MREKLLIIGAGGHSKVLLETAISTNLYDEYAFLDDCYRDEGEDLFVLGWPILGNTNCILRKLIKNKFNNAIVAIGNNKKRLEYIDELEKNNFKIPSLIHASAIISPSSKVNKGSVIFSNSVIQAGVTIGVGVIINTSSSIDHDCIINDGAHICPGVNLAGGVNVGRLSMVGIGASVIQNIKIGEEVIIGAGSVVINNLKNKMKVAGVPARLI